MFSGRQPRHDVKVLRRFRDWPRPHLQGVADGLVEPKLKNKCPTVYCVYLSSAWARDGMRPLCSRTASYRFWFYQTRGAKSVPETSQESYNIYIIQKNAQQILVFRRFGGPWIIPPPRAARSATTLSKPHRLWLLQGPGYRTHLGLGVPELSPPRAARCATTLCKPHRLWLLQGPRYRTHFTTTAELFSRFMIVHRFTVVPWPLAISGGSLSAS